MQWDASGTTTIYLISTYTMYISDTLRFFRNQNRKIITSGIITLQMPYSAGM